MRKMDDLLIAERADPMQLQQDELAARISQAVSHDGVIEVQPGLHLGKFSHPTGPVYASLPPSFCVVAQGTKDVLVG